jgi:hypothetical protein
MSIFDIAEKHGDWDDFGRWTFRGDDKLENFVYEVTDEKGLLEILICIQEERYATAESMLRKMISGRLEQPKRVWKVMDSSYPDGDGYWKDTKENVA